jgi:hypothetical protein
MAISGTGGMVMAGGSPHSLSQPVSRHAPPRKTFGIRPATIIAWRNAGITCERAGFYSPFVSSPTEADKPSAIA